MTGYGAPCRFCRRDHPVEEYRCSACGDKFLLLRNGVPEWTGTLAELKKMPGDFLMKFFRGEDL